MNREEEEPRARLKHVGNNVRIYPGAKIIRPEMVSIDDHSIINDFVVIEGGRGVLIGKWVHISFFSLIYGGGELVMEDFTGLAAGCRIVTGTDDFSGGSLTNSCIPPEFRNVSRSFVRIRRHAILGTNVVVLPGVTIGEGAAVGAMSLVREDVEPWTINVGIPSRPIAKRPKEIILRMERELRQRFGYGLPY